MAALPAAIGEPALASSAIHARDAVPESLVANAFALSLATGREDLR